MLNCLHILLQLNDLNSFESTVCFRPSARPCVHLVLPSIHSFVSFKIHQKEHIQIDYWHNRSNKQTHNNYILISNLPAVQLIKFSLRCFGEFAFLLFHTSNFQCEQHLIRFSIIFATSTDVILCVIFDSVRFVSVDCCWYSTKQARFTPIIA